MSSTASHSTIAFVPEKIIVGSTCYVHMAKGDVDYYAPNCFLPRAPPPAHMWRYRVSSEHGDAVFFYNEHDERSVWILPEVDAATGAELPGDDSKPMQVQGRVPSAASRMATQQQQQHSDRGRPRATQQTAVAVVGAPVHDKSPKPAAAAAAAAATAIVSTTPDRKHMTASEKLALWRQQRRQPQCSAANSKAVVAAAATPQQPPEVAKASMRPAPSSPPSIFGPAAKLPTVVEAPSAGTTSTTTGANPQPGTATATMASEAAGGTRGPLPTSSVFQQASAMIAKEKQSLQEEEALALEQQRRACLAEQAEEAARARLATQRAEMEARRVALAQKALEQRELLLQRQVEAAAAAEASRQCNEFLHEQTRLEEEVADTKAAEAQVDTRVDEGVLQALRHATARAKGNETRPRQGDGKSASVAPFRLLSVKLEEDKTSPFLTEKEVRELQPRPPPAPLRAVDQNAPVTPRTKEAPKTRKGCLSYSDAYVYVGDLVHLPGRRRQSSASLPHRPDLPLELLDSQREGTGTMYYKGPTEPTYYKGGWQADRPHGRGALSLPQTAVEGTWAEGQLDGPAVLRTPHLNGAVEFAHGTVDGPVAADLDNGARYVGLVQQDGSTRTDRGAAPGIFRLSSGDHVEWLRPRAPTVGRSATPQAQDRHVGTGVCRARFANGDVYVGEVEAFAMHGKGHYLFAEGGEYMGGFTHGFMTGTGIYTFENGNFYKGQMYKGLYHGRGVYVQKGEYCYEGAWEHGTMQGHGLLRFANGDVWEGEFDKDRRVRGNYVKVSTSVVMP